MPAPLAAPAGSGAQNPAAQPMSAGRIKAVAEDFEAVFLTGMLEEMFAGVGEDDPFGNGEGAATWRSLRTEELARSIARAGGIGLAEHVERHLIALQEKHS